MKPLALLLFVSFLPACSSINYSQMSPDSKTFHPKTIAVLPATIGQYEASRDVIDSAVSTKLVQSKWFTKVVDAASIKTQITKSTEISDELGKYIQQLNALGVSDPGLTGKLRKDLKADALFLTYVTSWGYGRQDGNKVARVGLGVKLVDASKGTVIWKANHELVEEYTLFKPKLNNMTDDLLAMLFKEMPH
ncbi:MAG: hypothetical protein ACHQYP_05460 [Nitrospiria bacterium]